MRKILKKIFIYILVNIININLFFLKNRRYVYAPLNSYGDCFEYYLKNFKKIKNKKILVFGNIDENIVRYLYGKKSYYKIFFFLKNLPTYEIFSFLNKKKNFQPFKPNINGGTDHLITKKEFKESSSILFNIIKQKTDITPKLKNIKKKKFILMHIKHYNTNINDLTFSASRQTSNLIKIFKLINYISRKYNILILGVKSDKHLGILKKKFYKKKEVLFLDEISSNYSIKDQIFCYQHSSGYIGSATGIVPILWLLKKKIIMFDTPLEESDKRFKSKKFVYLFKKYKIKKKMKFKNLNENNLSRLSKINVIIKEVTLKELKNKFDLLF